jgi:WD40 repeat protein
MLFSNNRLVIQNNHKLTIFDTNQQRMLAEFPRAIAEQLNIWFDNCHFPWEIKNEKKAMWDKNKTPAVPISAFEMKSQPRNFFAILPNQTDYLQISYEKYTYQLNLFNIENPKKPIMHFNHTHINYEFSHILPFADGQHFIAGTKYLSSKENALCLWKITESEPIHYFRYPAGSTLIKFAVMANGYQFLAAQEHARKSDIHLWDLKNQSPIATFKNPSLHQLRVQQIIPLPDGQHFIAHYNSTGVWIWNIDLPTQPVMKIRNDHDTAFGFSYLELNGTYCYLDGSSDATISRYELPYIKEWRASIYTILIHFKIPPGVDHMILDFAMSSVHDKLKFFKIPNKALENTVDKAVISKVCKT